MVTASTERHLRITGLAPVRIAHRKKLQDRALLEIIR